MEFFEQLKLDLNEKLDQWGWVLEEPALFIDDYFIKLRNEIDETTEKVLSPLADVPERDKEYQAINAQRTAIIERLEQHRKWLLSCADTLKSSECWSDSRRAFEQVGRNIETLECQMDDMEQQYLNLALTILEQKSILEEQSLGSNLPVFHKDLVPDRAILVVLNGARFSSFSLNCFR